MFPTDRGVHMTQLRQVAAPAQGPSFSQTAFERFTAPGQTEWVPFNTGMVMVGVSGVANHIKVVVERSFVSPTDPSIRPTDVICMPADVDPITGDCTVGIQPKVYRETAMGWWRAVVTEISGGQVIVALNGPMT